MNALRFVCVLLLAVVGASFRSVATAEFDHSHAAWTAVLKRHVAGHRNDYGALAKDRAELDRYLAALHAVTADEHARWSREQQFAFWINVYNAYTIQLVNLHHERESIRNINMFMGVLKGKGPWKETIVNAGGRTLSLEDVQIKVIRAEFKEPRVNMALVAGALSSPPLRVEAYEGSNLPG